MVVVVVVVVNVEFLFAALRIVRREEANCGEEEKVELGLRRVWRHHFSRDAAVTDDARPRANHLTCETKESFGIPAQNI